MCGLEAVESTLARVGPTTPKSIDPKWLRSIRPKRAAPILRGVVNVPPPACRAGPNAAPPSQARTGTGRAAGIAPVTQFTQHIGHKSVMPCRVETRRKRVGRTSRSASWSRTGTARHRMSGRRSWNSCGAEANHNTVELALIAVKTTSCGSSFPRSASERASWTLCVRSMGKASDVDRRRGASGRAFPRRAWERDPSPYLHLIYH